MNIIGLHILTRNPMKKYIMILLLMGCSENYSNVGGAPTSTLGSSEKEVDMLYRSINHDPHEGKTNV